MAKIPRRLRFEILRRDNHACRYCGRGAPEVVLEIDHVTPEVLGGRTDPANLVTACTECNGGKASVAPDSPLVEEVAQDALRWGRARRAAIEEWRRGREDLKAKLQPFADAWDNWTADDHLIPRAAHWEISVERWLDHGLTAEDLVDMIPIAMRAPPGGSPIPIDQIWRYYCGVVWRTLDQIERTTASHLGEESTGIALPHPIFAVASDGPEYLFAVASDGQADLMDRLCCECDGAPVYAQGLCRGCLTADVGGGW
jgi:hypothetical protein